MCDKWVIYKNKPQPKKYYSTIIDGKQVTNYPPLMRIMAFLELENEIMNETPLNKDSK